MVYEDEADVEARLEEIRQDKDRPRTTLIDKLNDWFKEIYRPDHAIATIFPPGLLYKSLTPDTKKNNKRG